MNESNRRRLERANAGVRRAVHVEAQVAVRLSALDDAGQMRFSVNPIGARVVVDFGRPVMVFGMGAREARELAALLNSCADEAEDASKQSLTPRTDQV